MTQPIILPEKLDTAAASGLREVLMKTPAGPLSLDGRRVKILGALGLQLLLAAQFRVRAEGHAFTLQASKELALDIETMGASGLLDASLTTVPGERA